jgi:hypothetical protein
MSASTTVQQFGFAADDVAAIAPELVDNVGGIKLVRTSDLIPLLVNSVNDLATKVDSLDTRVSKLEATLASTTSATTTPGVATAGTTDTNFIVNTVLGAFQNMGTQISQGMAHFTSVFADNIVIGSQEKPAGITLYDIATHLPYCLRIENGGQVTAPGTCADTISAGVAQAPSNVTITSTSTTTPTGVATTGSGSTATSTPSTFSNNTSNTSGTTTATTGSASTTATTGTASTTASASTATDSSVSSSASTTPTG